MFRKIGILFIAMQVFLLRPCHAAQYTEDDIHGKTGFEESRTYEGMDAHENIDPYSGNLIFTIPLFSFPGNGGLDLNLTLVYNSKVRKMNQGGVLIPWDSMGLGWSLHLARVEDPWRVSGFPVIVMPDGSRHVLFPNTDFNPTEWRTKEFWRYKITTINGLKWAILTLADGTQYKFRLGGTWNGSTISGQYWYPVEEIEDTSGNKITITNAYKNYAGYSYTFFIDSIKDSCSRVVQFQYYTSGTLRKGLQKITANNKSYTFTYDDFLDNSGRFLLKTVTPPEGKPWKFDYLPSGDSGSQNEELTQVTYPAGGKINYTYDTQTHAGFDTVRSLKTKTSHRPIVPSGGFGWGSSVIDDVWTYSYDRYIQDGGRWIDRTIVTNPDGDDTVYEYLAVKPGYWISDGQICVLGHMISKKIYNGSYPSGTLLQREDYVWGSHISNPNEIITISPADSCFGIYCVSKTYNSLLVTQTTTRYDTPGYQDSYNTNYLSYDAYGNPTQIEETSNLYNRKRTTNKTYWTDVNQNILSGKIDVENVKVTGNSTFTKNYDYYPAGKVKRADEYGVVKAFTYYYNGNLETVTDEDGDATQYMNYSYGKPTDIQTPEYSYQQSVNYEGTISSVTRSTVTGYDNNSGSFIPSSHTTYYTYDGLNRMTSISPPLGFNTVIVYDPNSTYKKVSRGNYYAQFNYDGYGRLISTSNSVGITTNIDYDALGRKSYESYPYDSSTVNDGVYYQYDALGRVIKETYPVVADQMDGNGRDVLYNYEFQNSVKITNQRGIFQKYYYEAFGSPNQKQLVKVADANNAITSYEHNTIGQLTKVYLPQTAGGSLQHKFNYGTPQGQNLLYSEIHPGNGTTIYSYYPDGQTKTKTNNKGETITYSYDHNNRLTNVGYSTDPTLNATFDYDASDNRIYSSTGNRAYRYLYDLNNNIKEVMTTDNVVQYYTDYSYDGKDNLSGIRYPTGRNVNYVYDAGNRVVRVPGYVDNDITYHASGGVNTIQYNNGLSRTIHYDSRYRYHDSSVPGVFDLDLRYDPVGNVREYTLDHDPLKKKTLTYDSLDRLTHAAGGLPHDVYFTYDGLGNRLTKNDGNITNYTYDYSATNRLVNVGGVQQTYDGNGNYKGPAGATLLYDYDIENRLTQANGVLFSYDADGLRTIKDPGIGGAGIRSYYYDMNGNVLTEMNGNGLALSDYIYLNGKILSKVELDSDNDGIANAVDNCPNIANPGQADCDGDGLGDVCDPVPSSTEICDGLDNDCDGQVDEGFPVSPYYQDNDSDGFGNSSISVQTCYQPAGYVPDSTDCDDNNPAVHPGVAELCNDTDDNCDGQVDEGLSADVDGDGHYGVGSCFTPNDDCNDTDVSIHPGAVDVCDGIDKDCGGEIENVTICSSQDYDGDTLSDWEEVNLYNTDPTLADTDGDGFTDDQEVVYGSNPVDPGSYPVPPVAGFSGTPNSGKLPLNVVFSDLSTNKPATWLWDFGDGFTSREQHPAHVYERAGTYTVSLVVSNVVGADSTFKADYVVLQPCTNLPVRIAGSTPTYYKTLQAAYNAAVDGDIIQSHATHAAGFYENINADRNISVTIDGGYDCDYVINSGLTAIIPANGSAIVSAGTLTMSNAVIEAYSDTDSDGMPDPWETLYRLNPNVMDAQGDPDLDGLTNLAEFQARTDPTVRKDTDGDRFTDDWETAYGKNPAVADNRDVDTDGDGMTDFEEFLAGTDPTIQDTDGDGVSDYDEAALADVGYPGADALDPNITPNMTLQEVQDALNTYASLETCTVRPVRIVGKKGYHTLQAAYNDAVDGDVIQVHAVGLFEPSLDLNRAVSVDIEGGYNCDFTSNPAYTTIKTVGGNVNVLSGTVTLGNVIIVEVPDTDADGLPDEWELLYGLDPTDPADAAADPDGDGLNNLNEFLAGTDPTNWDTDGDGLSDGIEAAYGSDPLDANAIPVIADGDLNDDGVTDAGDLVLAQRIALGVITPTNVHLAHGDVAPVGAPDGVIDGADVVVIQRMALGL